MGLMPQIYILLLHIPARIKKLTCTDSVPAARMVGMECENIRKRKEEKRKNNLALHLPCTVHCILAVGREVNQQSAIDSAAACHVLLQSGKFLL